MDLERAQAQVKEKTDHPGVTIGLLLFLTLNVVMLVIGIIKKDECPIDDRIPLYLLVAGAIGISSKILPLVNRKLDWCLVNFVVSILYLFEFIWTIVGSVWVYSIYKPNFDKGQGPYCSESAYLMSFWLLTIHWIFLGLSIIFGCCCCCCLCKSK